MIKKFVELSKSNKTISVIGDFILDQYFQVRADRISPEFPIIRILSEDEDCKEVLGGAGNVAMQFKNFNIDVKLFTFLDTHSMSVVKNNGLETSYSTVLPNGYNVPRKRRFYDGNFPLSRWDVEKACYGCDSSTLKSLQNNLLNRFLTQKADVVIISDYDKGVFYKNKKAWVSNDYLTIVDPKRGCVDDWMGCYIFKPNNKEAIELSGGITDWKEQCKYFSSILKCKAVVITQGGDGVVGIVNGKLFEYRPNYETDNICVIGAGDCFAAFLAMGMAHNMDIEEAATTAFCAGAAYVSKRHNDPITPQELLGLTSEKDKIKSLVSKYMATIDKEEKDLFIESLRRL